MPRLRVTSALYDVENHARARGIQIIVGVDEAGRGPLAGPVVAAAVRLPANLCLDGLNDSKLLSPSRRERLYQEIVDHPSITWAVGVVTPAEIDRINILQATWVAMRQAVVTTGLCADLILVDGNSVPALPFPSQNIIKGDRKCACIAAASVIAKVHRDRIMAQLDHEFPGYGFRSHKGYGTRKHLAALAALGPSPIHRRSFAPVAQAGLREPITQAAACKPGLQLEIDF